MNRNGTKLKFLPNKDDFVNCQSANFSTPFKIGTFIMRNGLGDGEKAIQTRSGMMAESSPSVYSSRRIRSVISWFSCGVDSASATKIALEKYGTVEIYYTDTGMEHEYNPRFKRWYIDNQERIIECALIDWLLDKEDFLWMLDQLGIDIPTMHKLGFRNNNCFGCVKALDILD